MVKSIIYMINDQHYYCRFRVIEELLRVTTEETTKELQEQRGLNKTFAR